VVKKTFFIDNRFYYHWPISVIIWCIVHQINLQHNSFDLPTSPTYCCYTTSREISFMLTSSSKTVHQQSMHHAHQTIKLLQCETPKLIPSDLQHPNNPNVNPVDYRMWGVMQMQCVRWQFETWPTRGSTWLTLGIACHKTLWMVLLMNGVRDFVSLWVKKKPFWTLEVICRLKCRLVMQTSLLLLVFVSSTITGQSQNSIFIRRV